MHGRHGVNGCLREDPLPLVHAAAEHHPVELQHVCRRAVHAALRGGVLPLRSRRVALVALELAVRKRVDGRDASHLVLRRKERRVGHAQRLKQPLLNEVFVALAGHNLDYSAKRRDAEVVVTPALAGFRHHRFARPGRHNLGKRMRVG